MINSATYIGTTVGGIPGALVATLGAVTPSFIIILLIAKFFSGLMKHEGAKTVLDTIKPCVVGIILSTGVYLILTGLLPKAGSLIAEGFSARSLPEWRTLLIFGLVLLFRCVWRLWKKKTVPPILSIVAAAALGVLVFGV